MKSICAKLYSTLCTTAIAALLAGCPGKQSATKAPPQPPVPVQTAVVQKKDMPLDLRTIGSVEAIANIPIQAQVGGELIEMNFKEGSEVKKGQLLFTIQPRLFATRVAEAEANLARDKATATNARLALERQMELDRKGAGVKEELDKARAASEAADAAVKADEALLLIAQTQLGYSTIESPIDGRTGGTSVRPGALVKVADPMPLTTVVQMAPIYVAFTLPEAHLTKIRQGVQRGALPVTVLDPRPGTKLGEGELTFIANEVDKSTGTIGLKATFKNEDRALWPGAFVDVVLHLDVEKDAVTVPSPAISLGQRGAQLWVVKPDGTVELRTVKTGRSVGQETIILEGVTPGDKIVMNGQSRLLPGAKIVEKNTATPEATKVAKGETP